MTPRQKLEQIYGEVDAAWQKAGKPLNCDLFFWRDDLGAALHLVGAEADKALEDLYQDLDRAYNTYEDSDTARWRIAIREVLDWKECAPSPLRTLEEVHADMCQSLHYGASQADLENWCGTIYTILQQQAEEKKGLLAVLRELRGDIGNQAQVDDTTRKVWLCDVCDAIQKVGCSHSNAHIQAAFVPTPTKGVNIVCKCGQTFFLQTQEDGNTTLKMQ